MMFLFKIKKLNKAVGLVYQYGLLKPILLNPWYISFTLTLPLEFDGICNKTYKISV
jgi:hypothetical protein